MALLSPLAPEAGEAANFSGRQPEGLGSAGRSPCPPGPYYIEGCKPGVKLSALTGACQAGKGL